MGRGGKKRDKGGNGKKRSRSRRLSLRGGIVLAVLLLLWAVAGEWFVHRPRPWVDEACRTWPNFATSALLRIGNPLADVTDGLGWTGHDAVYEYDLPAPSGNVFFAGEPRRIGEPAPADIEILDRGPFKIGWSRSLRHPVWCAYHVVRTAPYPIGKRPSFTLDPSLPSAPRPDAYRNSGYDRGHMVPNYAIVTRYGEAAQKRTFMMSNISPQSPALNRGVWRDLEHRIADFWTARYGEIWVVVGCISSSPSTRLRLGPGVDIPTEFYQVIMAQEGADVRALAVLFSQQVSWTEWAARRIVTIDELERRTGLDFNPDLPAFIQEPMEADLPTRLWPVRPIDIFRQIALRFNY